MAAAARLTGVRAHRLLVRGLFSSSSTVTSKPSPSCLLPLRHLRTCTPFVPLKQTNVTTAPLFLRQFHVHGAPLLSVKTFKLADIGEGIAEAEILKWYVKEGDNVKEFEKLCDVQSDKATTDITSRYEGRIVKIYYATNEMAKVGTPLVDIDTAGTSHASESTPSAPAASLSPSSSTKPPVTPSVHESVKTTSTSTTHVVDEAVLMTPAVRNLIRVNKLNPALIPATGRNGRLMKEDVLQFLESGGNITTTPTLIPSTSPSKPAPSSTTSPFVAPSPVPTALAQDKVEAVRGVKRIMVKSMTAALKVPHFGYCDEIEMDALMGLRKSLAVAAQKKGIKLSFMPFLLKAASLALVEYPVLNSHVNEECTEITYKASHNISIAMDTPAGLVVPVIRDVQRKGIFEIARDLNDLQKLGNENKLSTEHFAGGTFSLSNIGTVGGTYTKPVLVVPQVAIGAMGKIRKLPRYDEKDNIVPVNIMEISWSADHRVIDGVTMAKFSNRMKYLVENPLEMLV